MFGDNMIFYDPTHPGARDFVWKKVKEHYYDAGIKTYFLDACEPAYNAYYYDNYRYYKGRSTQIGNSYPLEVAKNFYDGLTAAGEDKPVNIIRSAWAGSQRYGALVWSGDIRSTFDVLRYQISSGLNMGIAGIPWWTTDIGGYWGGEIKNPAFHELLIRWFEWGCFCPVMRLHGHRFPYKPGIGKTGGGIANSGQDNEVWSFSEEAYSICKKYLFLREKLKPYIAGLMKAAHEKGTPVMRPLFYDFPEDPETWEMGDQYMFGPNYLVAPVVYEGARERKLYLPAGSKWTNAWTGEIIEGGQSITVDAPLDIIPVFSRDGSRLW
jgi:alpha-D-xyloside xylohydrolase